MGLTGSTEWGEHFAPELKEGAVAYLNIDSSAAGPDFHSTLRVPPRRGVTGEPGDGYGWPFSVLATP